MVSLTAACARPMGDLGRPEMDGLHETVMPAIGAEAARVRGEPVSRFNLTDQEVLMRNRIWRFLEAPRTESWFQRTATELQRTRIAGPTDAGFPVSAYYDWLHDTRYQSSAVRYATLADDVGADLATLADTFEAICAVEQVDRRRAFAASGIYGLPADTTGDVAARRAENQAAISWFTRALDYRYRSYSYALDRLLVETPHPEARKADDLLADMQVWVGEARAGRFCGAGRIVETGHRARPAIPSRYAAPQSGPTKGS